jgi:hypothetical protein
VFSSRVPDVELRLAAAEALLEALAPWLDEEATRGVRATLRGDLIAARGDRERLVCLHALQLLEEWLRRPQTIKSNPSGWRAPPGGAATPAPRKNA